MPKSQKPLPPSYPRLRTRGAFGAPTVVQEKAVAGPRGGETWLQPRGYASGVGEVEAMADVVVPGFPERRANGEILFNPMNRTRHSLQADSIGPAVVRVRDDSFLGQSYEFYGNFLPFSLGGSVDPSSARPALGPKPMDKTGVSRAIAEASTKALRPPSDASLLVTLAEMDKTRRLVPDLLNNWSALFQKLNRVSAPGRRMTALQAGVKDAKRNLGALERTLTETWLAMRFGVRPLIMDTLGLIKAANKVYESQAVRLTQRGAASYSDSSTSTFVQTYGVTQTTISQSNHGEAMVRAMSLWEVKMDQLRNSGVSLSAVPEAAIDLLKFSFVLNWVINVNDFFASLGALADPALTNRGGCYVLRTLETTTWQATGTVSLDPTTWAVTRPVSGIVTAVLETQSRIVGLNQPKLVVRANPMKFLGDARLVDAIALLRQQTRGRNVRYLAALGR